MSENITASDGIAQWIIAPPAWLVAAAPGAAKALAAFDAVDEEGRRLHAARKAAREAKAKLVRPTIAESEKARRAVEDTERAVLAHTPKAKRALQDVDNLLRAFGQSDDVVAPAARLALEKHEEAIAAFATFREALALRDEAWSGSGYYGRERAPRDSGYIYADESGLGTVTRQTLNSAALHAGEAALATFPTTRVRFALEHPEVEAVAE